MIEDELKSKEQEEKPEPKQEARKKPVEKEPELALEDGTVVAADGLGIHVIAEGKRRWVPDTWTQAKLMITWSDIVMLFPEQLMSIPEGKPIPSMRPLEPLF